MPYPSDKTKMGAIQMTPNGSDYFRRISRAFQEIKVTRKRGKPISCDEAIGEAVGMIGSLAENSKKALLVGNGGSAALVSHAQNDLCASVGVRALVFNEASLLTALANDYGYETAYSRLVKLWADPDDLLIAVSSSGKSRNILLAVEIALERGCQVLTLSGFQSDNPLRALGDLNFYVSSDAYGFVEVTHMAVLHVLTDLTMLLRVQEKGKKAHV